MYYCVLDFEATCVQPSDPRYNEIIEFPGILFKHCDCPPAPNAMQATPPEPSTNPPPEPSTNPRRARRPKQVGGRGCTPAAAPVPVHHKSPTTTLIELGRFEAFVCPRDNTVGAFCTELTSITPEMVAGAPTFPKVFAQYNSWLAQLAESEGIRFTKENFIFVTAGSWDLKTMLPKDLRRWGVGRVPNIWTSWLDIKYPFRANYPSQGRKAGGGMAGMLARLNLVLEGTAHRGIDDCHNIGKILTRMVEDGHANTFPSFVQHTESAECAHLPQRPSKHDFAADAITDALSRTKRLK